MCKMGFLERASQLPTPPCRTVQKSQLPLRFSFCESSFWEEYRGLIP